VPSHRQPQRDYAKNGKKSKLSQLREQGYGLLEG
jgi:hypothetical protein